MTWTVTIIYVDGRVDHYPNLTPEATAQAIKFALEHSGADTVLGISVTPTKN